MSTGRKEPREPQSLQLVSWYDVHVHTYGVHKLHTYVVTDMFNGARVDAWMHMLLFGYMVTSCHIQKK